MSKFTDYLASQITPQMTLLEKFNALLKYLEEIDEESKELSGFEKRYCYNFKNLQLNSTQETFLIGNFTLFSNVKITDSSISSFKELLKNEHINVSAFYAEQNDFILGDIHVENNLLTMSILYYNDATIKEDKYGIIAVDGLDLDIIDLNTGKVNTMEI